MVKFLGATGITMLISISSLAGDCEVRFEDEIRLAATKRCQAPPIELAGTGSYLIKATAQQNGDQYGFFFRCKNGESFVGIVLTQNKGSTCKVKVERVGRLEFAIFESNSENKGK